MRVEQMGKLKRAILSSAVGAVKVEEDGMATQRYCFPSNFIGFSGHFPGYPILPAFVQISIALTLAEEVKGGPLELAAIEKAKFLLELRPDQEIVVQVRERRIGERPGCEAHLLADEKVAASFRMIFEEKG